MLAADKLGINKFVKFTLFVKSRTDYGGGVALLIRNDVGAEKILLPCEFDEDEIVGVEIELQIQIAKLRGYQKLSCFSKFLI